MGENRRDTVTALCSPLWVRNMERALCNCCKSTKENTHNKHFCWYKDRLHGKASLIQTKQRKEKGLWIQIPLPWRILCKVEVRGRGNKISLLYLNIYTALRHRNGEVKGKRKQKLLCSFRVYIQYSCGIGSILYKKQ